MLSSKDRDSCGASDGTPSEQRIIQLDDVSRVYPGLPPVEALRSCNLSVAAGEYVTVVGRSGSGKSTLLNLLGLLDQPSSGRYCIRGRDVSALSDAQRAALRARHIGFIFQAFHLLPYRTSEENVALSLLHQGVRREERLQSARAALDRVGLADRMAAYPTQLSGGEKQRVAVARALTQSPSLLLCDEPTGNLDSASAANLLSLIDEVHAEGLTIVMITHDPEIAARGTRQFAILDGILTERFTDRSQAGVFRD